MEKLLQFVWQHLIGLRGELRTVDGRKLRVVDPGTLNRDAGPDFFNASIEIEGERWAGNVEIHVRASDWNRHGHQTDPAYDSVLLHVVMFDDERIRRANGCEIPQLVVDCPPDTPQRCNNLVAFSVATLPCRQTIEALQPIYITDWLTALAFERLYAKSDRILQQVADSNGDWASAAFVTLGRALGFGLNSEPFEVLTRNLPLRFLQKHSDNLPTIEAILFGQAGLLPPADENDDPYLTLLRQEYTFMARKFSLRPIPIMWKMARTRPWNFPHRRLAVLAEIVHRGFDLPSRLADTKGDPEAVRGLLSVQLQGFWATHFTFTSGGARSPFGLKEQSVETLAINVAAPMMHARASWIDDQAGMDAAVELWQRLRPEDNAITRLFATAGLRCPDAFTSQALIELRRNYCERRKCIYCRFGQRMLAAEILRHPAPTPP